jgi:Rrf2 family nitric oxide-sensitive transcriptional repressor
MRLTTFSDYALRVLMYAAAAGDRLITIEETAEAYDISRAHLMKVVNILTRTGYIRGVRGRSGGFTLARPPEAINLGDVVRATEPDFALVECFATGNQCLITRRCRLPEVLNEALSAFIGTLDRYTLADIVLGERAFVAPRGRIEGTRGPHLKKAARRAGQRAGQRTGQRE